MHIFFQDHILFCHFRNGTSFSTCSGTLAHSRVTHRCSGGLDNVSKGSHYLILMLADFPDISDMFLFKGFMIA